jgi:hypothetical protein
MKSGSIFRSHIAVPQDHGSWVFLFTPLATGLFAGGSFTIGSLALTAGESDMSAGAGRDSLGPVLLDGACIQVLYQSIQLRSRHPEESDHHKKS